MIGYLRGKIVDRSDEALIVDVAGVGYEVHCSTHTQGQLENVDEAVLWVQTHVREDIFQLFGFATQIEKRMFNSLLKVNGVGPKMAVKILSAARLEELAQMIELGDVKGLSNLPKVGKKTAEQLILTLKGKFVLTPESGRSGESSKTKKLTTVQPRFSGNRADILSALVNLGFRLQEAEPIVERFAEDVDVQDGIRDGLRALAGGI